MEYMQWCIDMGMEAVLAVWAGLALNGASILTGSALTPYIDDILNELEFLLGDTSTTYGALRAAYGRSEPYSLTRIEVGNEDNLSSGCSTYASRFQAIYNAVHAAYPDLIIIASTSDSSCLPSPLPDGVVTDIHFYESPKTFVGLFNYFDNWSRDNGIFVGEYAATSNNDGSALYWTNVESSCGEAVFMIGLERNSDLVQMASYAPLLEHFDLAEWSPNLFGVSSVPGSITGSTSFYVQKLFSTNRGTKILPVTSNSAFGPVYWVASSTDAGTYYVKLANYGTAEESVTIEIPGATLSTTATLHLVSGDADTSNYPLDVSVTDTTSSVSGSADDGYTFTIPAYGVAVFAVSS
jgi:alpha-N-arabinofuranosidase